MDRKEAEMSLRNDWYVSLNNNGNLIVEHDKVNRFLEACGMGIKALQEPEIVHCKDCRLRKTEECAMQYECDCGEQHSWENDNDYCSWGKRYEE